MDGWAAGLDEEGGEGGGGEGVGCLVALALLACLDACGLPSGLVMLRGGVTVLFSCSWRSS